MPIDPEFQKRRKKVGKENGIAIWGPVDPPEKLGTCGTYVALARAVSRKANVRTIPRSNYARSPSRIIL